MNYAPPGPGVSDVYRAGMANAAIDPEYARLNKEWEYAGAPARMDLDEALESLFAEMPHIDEHSPSGTVSVTIATALRLKRAWRG